MKRNAFTLLELTVVISIIAILASILFPLFARARETARRGSCASNLQQIGVALNMYASAYDGHYPEKDNELGLLGKYGSLDIFFCPSDPADRYWEVREPKRGDAANAFGTPGIPIKTYSSYVYRGGLSNDDRADIPIASESQLWHRDVGNVLYPGGYVKGLPEGLFEPIVKPTHEPVERRGSPTPSSGGG